MLENIFGSRTRIKLLKIFLQRPSEAFFVRELARMAEEKINSVRRELDNLVDIGLIKSLASSLEKSAKKNHKSDKKFYQADTDFVLYEEFRNLILKSRLLLEKTLAKELKNLGKIKFLMLSGFFVGYEHAPTDMLIVGQVPREKLRALIKKMEKNFGQEIKYTLMTENEFAYRNKITDKFLFEVLEGKKMVILDNLKKSE
ncbi:MAG TPA: hypothetical protein PKZ16_00845 [bacterium]|nr:hypothetical protein [bacterium]HPL95431.1 hypothetical protein [bacterium]